MVTLVQNKTDVVAPRVGQFSDHLAFSRAWNTYDASIAKYYLEFQPDGSFRVSDVLPGQYTLAVSVKAPPADPMGEDAWLYPGPVLGGITNTIVVPSPSEESSDGSILDLGVIPIPSRTSVPKTAQAP